MNGRFLIAFTTIFALITMDSYAQDNESNKEEIPLQIIEKSLLFNELQVIPSFIIHEDRSEIELDDFIYQLRKTAEIMIWEEIAVLIDGEWIPFYSADGLIIDAENKIAPYITIPKDTILITKETLFRYSIDTLVSDSIVVFNDYIEFKPVFYNEE